MIGNLESFIVSHDQSDECRNGRRELGQLIVLIVVLDNTVFSSSCITSIMRFSLSTPTVGLLLQVLTAHAQSISQKAYSQLALPCPPPHPATPPINIIPGNWRWHKLAAGLIAEDLAGPQTQLRC